MFGEPAHLQGVDKLCEADESTKRVEIEPETCAASPLLASPRADVWFGYRLRLAGDEAWGPQQLDRRRGGGLLKVQQRNREQSELKGDCLCRSLSGGIDGPTNLISVCSFAPPAASSLHAPAAVSPSQPERGVSFSLS